MIDRSIQRMRVLLDSIDKRCSQISHPNVREANSIDDLLSTEALFLVTPGRSGTASLVDFCARYTTMLCEHAPNPWLASIGYEYHQGRIGGQAAGMSFYAAREPYLLRAYQQQRTFFDGDCKNLPLAAEIARMLPNSRFIHVVRNPAGFISSGLRRGYYKHLSPELWGHLQEPGHGVSPRHAKISPEEQIRKIAYFWNEANLIAESLKKKLEAGRIATIIAEDMFRSSEVILEALSELGLSNRLRGAKKYKVKELNKQKRGEEMPDHVRPIIEKVIENDCTTKAQYYEHFSSDRLC